MKIFAKAVYRNEQFILFKLLKFIGKHTIFIMSFDEITNIVGGVIMDDSLMHHIWYVDFGIRMLVMSACLIVYITLIKIIEIIRKRLL